MQNQHIFISFKKKNRLEAVQKMHYFINITCMEGRIITIA